MGLLDVRLMSLQHTPMIQFSETELQRRRPVWQALSDLFLDTETRPAVPAAAQVCEASQYSIDELNIIWRHEVSPVLAPNLLSVAGEWAFFDPEWLEETILACEYPAPWKPCSG